MPGERGHGWKGHKETTVVDSWTAAFNLLGAVLAEANEHGQTINQATVTELTVADYNIERSRQGNRDDDYTPEAVNRTTEQED